MAIDLDPRAASKIRQSGLGVGKVSEKVRDLIVNEFNRRVKSFEKTTIRDGHVVFVFLEPILKMGTTLTPVTMSVSSWNVETPEIVKTYTGEKLCFYLIDNSMMTIKVKSSESTPDELAADAEAHLLRKKNLRMSATVINADNAKFLIELNSNGDVSAAGAPPKMGGKILTGEREYALTQGRPIKVYLKFMNGMTEVEIDEVMNRRTARADGFIKLAIKLPNGNKSQKILKPGDPISVLIEDEWYDFKVADSLFVDYANRGGAFAVKIQS